ncbi:MULTISPECIES: hypothetical protein [unclassified Enterobacter cloacae complex]|uniref:hypothetical protein n=1 Tax=unclassified Enterobacter cloacae complex TaxID=2757714 RepID=UPI0018737B94|nr:MULTISPECIES: hypothetical protein [unclassified Enterobacter cloacae complex]MBE4946842.1 hypothetical protein [Enterobacter cloacae complex sp. P1B]MBE4971664.1 hypothetical protein [Enterobacter cloacae complex sp. P11RS]
MKCPEPLDGLCDCDKCKAMRLHESKNFYVCLVCHKRVEPLTPIDLNSNDWLPDKTEQFIVNLADWIKQEVAELGENAFYHPNTEYFKVLREINFHEKEFVANSLDLLKMARKHSITYDQLTEKDKSVIDFWLMEEIFLVTYDDE